VRWHVLQFLLVCFLAEGMTKDDTFCLMLCAALWSRIQSWRSFHQLLPLQLSLLLLPLLPAVDGADGVAIASCLS